MKNHYIIFLLIICSAFSCKKKEVYQGVETIINNVNIVELDRVSYDGPQDVVIRDGKIFKIGQHNKSLNANVINGEGKYLMPGLTEMHAHIPTPDENGDDSLVGETLFLYLSQGVTTIRGMLGDPYHLELKKMIADGDMLSPRVYTSSPSVNGGSVKSVEEAQEKVAQYKADGYDFLKIHPGVKLEVWEAIEATAKEVGIPYAGHVPVEVGIHRALEAGYATVDHLDGYIDGLIRDGEDIDPDGGGFFGFLFTEMVDEEKIDQLAAKTKSLGVGVVPTQTLFTRWYSPEDPAEMMQQVEMKYMPSKTRFAWRQNKERMIADENYSEEQWKRYIDIRKQILKAMHEEGVELLLGSDAPQVMNVPGFSIHHEMQDMVDAGIPIDAVLKSGTSSPAKFFDAADQYGTLAVGMEADLILLNADPLVDISNAKEINGVMCRGEWLSRSMIDTRLSEIAKRNE